MIIKYNGLPIQSRSLLFYNNLHTRYGMVTEITKYGDQRPVFV